MVGAAAVVNSLRLRGCMILILPPPAAAAGGTAGDAEANWNDGTAADDDDAAEPHEDENPLLLLLPWPTSGERAAEPTLCWLGEALDADRERRGCGELRSEGASRATRGGSVHVHVADDAPRRRQDLAACAIARCATPSPRRRSAPPARTRGVIAASCA